MRWSWRIGQVAGIGVYLHGTFLLLLAFVVLSHLWTGHGLGVAALGVFSIASIFGIVVLHELGHALAARRYGIKTQDITLLPIGGIARLERMPDDPKQEFVVALAGPAVNVLLGVIAYLVIMYWFPSPWRFPFQRMMQEDILVHLPQLSQMLPPEQVAQMIGFQFLLNFLKVNIILVLFNLLPAFPMDGGRVLRSLLAMRMEHVRATQIAATIGQGMAFLFAFAGLMGQPILLFTALFVWMGAAAEAEMAQTKSALGGARVSHAMVTNFQTLAPRDPLTRAVGHILEGFQQDFPVLDEGRVVGVLTRGDLLKAVGSSGQDALVGDAMQRQFETAAPAEMLEHVFNRLQECDCHVLPVLQGDQLVGLVTMDNLGEFMLVQSALRGKGTR